MAVTYRPDADDVDGNWLNEAGTNTNLYASVDESVASDTDYIRNGTTLDAVRLGLNAPGDMVVNTGTPKPWLGWTGYLPSETNWVVNTDSGTYTRASSRDDYDLAANVNISGATRLLVIDREMVSGVAPVYANDNNLGWRASEQAGTTDDPELFLNGTTSVFSGGTEADGTVKSQGSTNYADIRAGNASLVVFATNDGNAAGQKVNDQAGNNYEMWQVFIGFDTSGEVSQPTSAVFRWSVYAGNADGRIDTRILDIYLHDFGTALETTDWIDLTTDTTMHFDNRNRFELRMAYDNTSTPYTLTVELYEGTTSRGLIEWPIPVSTTYAVQNIPLPDEVINAVTSFSDMRIEIEVLGS